MAVGTALAVGLGLEARASEDLRADLSGCAHIDCTREKLNEVGEEGGGCPRFALQIGWELAAMY